MRTAILRASALAALTGCAAPTGPAAFTGLVSQVTLQEGYAPGGYISQYDVWLAIPPSSLANAAVVVGRSAPVTIYISGRTIVASASAIRVGDQIEIWHDAPVVYGSVQAPPGAPAYFPTRVVVLR